jgi:hypothetical protein
VPSSYRAAEDQINGEDVFATLGEAKEKALAQAIPERDSWAFCVRNIREATAADAM